MHASADRCLSTGMGRSPPNPGSLFYVLRYPNMQRESKCVLAQGALSLYPARCIQTVLPRAPRAWAARGRAHAAVCTLCTHIVHTVPTVHTPAGVGVTCHVTCTRTAVSRFAELAHWQVGQLHEPV